MKEIQQGNLLVFRQITAEAVYKGDSDTAVLFSLSWFFLWWVLVVAF